MELAAVISQGHVDGGGILVTCSVAALVLKGKSSWYSRDDDGVQGQSFLSMRKHLIKI